MSEGNRSKSRVAAEQMEVLISVSREVYDKTRATLEAGMTVKGECERALQALGEEAACARPEDVSDVRWARSRDLRSFIDELCVIIGSCPGSDPVTAIHMVEDVMKKVKAYEELLQLVSEKRTLEEVRDAFTGKGPC